MNRAVFLDRDGVINELVYHREAGVIDSPFTVEQFKLIAGVCEAISILHTAGFKVFVVSNQPGLAKDHFTLETLQAMHDKMKAELKAKGACLDGIYFCPHHPEGTHPEYGGVCRCRKPQPGLFEQAAADHDIDLPNSYMIGDNLTDIQAGINAGCKTILLGKMKCELCRLMEEQQATPDHISNNLLEAARYIEGLVIPDTDKISSFVPLPRDRISRIYREGGIR